MDDHDQEIPRDEYHGNARPWFGDEDDPFGPPASAEAAPAPVQAPSEAPGIDEDAPLALGTRFVGEFPVPEILQYDHQFLSLPRASQKLILKNVQEGLFLVQRPPVTDRTVKKTARLRVGQWERLGEIVAGAREFEEDRRKNLTENSLLREVLEMFFTLVVPDLDLSAVSTEDGLRAAVMRAYRASSARPHVD